MTPPEEHYTRKAIEWLISSDIELVISEPCMGSIGINDELLNNFEDFVSNRDLFFANIHGISTECYREYIDIHQARRCVAATKAGRQCQCDIHGTYMNLHSYWDAYKAGDNSRNMCKTHGEMDGASVYVYREDVPLLPLKERVAREGFIYFVREQTEGHIKIGKTVDLNDRLRTFSVKLPFKIMLEHSFKCADYSRAESILHAHFSDYRIGGEWFDLPHEELSNTKSESFISSLGIEVLK